MTRGKWSLTAVVLQGRCRLDASPPTRTRQSLLRASCPASPACWAQWLSSGYSCIAFSPQPPISSAGKAAPLAPASRLHQLMMLLVVRAAEHRPRTPNPAPSGRGGRSVLTIVKCTTLPDCLHRALCHTKETPTTFVLDRPLKHSAWDFYFPDFFPEVVSYLCSQRIVITIWHQNTGHNSY
jgi:hypothetical protein